jgi:hypothetical protein
LKELETAANEWFAKLSKSLQALVFESEGMRLKYVEKHPLLETFKMLRKSLQRRAFHVEGQGRSLSVGEEEITQRLAKCCHYLARASWMETAKATVVDTVVERIDATMEELTKVDRKKKAEIQVATEKMKRARDLEATVCRLREDAWRQLQEVHETQFKRNADLIGVVSQETQCLKDTFDAPKMDDAEEGRYQLLSREILRFASRTRAATHNSLQETVKKRGVRPRSRAKSRCNCISHLDFVSYFFDSIRRPNPAAISSPPAAVTEARRRRRATPHMFPFLLKKQERMVAIAPVPASSLTIRSRVCICFVCPYPTKHARIALTGPTRSGGWVWPSDSGVVRTPHLESASLVCGDVFCSRSDPISKKERRRICLSGVGPCLVRGFGHMSAVLL